MLIEHAFEDETGGGAVTITATVVPTQVTALYDALHTLGSLGPTGYPRVGAALLRAVSTVGGLALREVAAVDADGNHAEVVQRSACPEDEKAG